MKILFVNHFPLTGSGSGVYTANLAKSLNRLGHEIAIVFPENRQKYEEYEGISLYPVFFKGEEEIPNENQLDMNFPCFTTHPRSTFNFREMTDEQREQYEKAFMEKINSVIEDFKPDIVHAQHIWTLAGISAVCAKKHNIPLVVTCHGTDLMGIKDEKERNENWGTKWANYAVDYTDSIVTISKDSNALAEEYLPKSKEKNVWIRNGVDSHVFFPNKNINKKEVLNKLGIDKDYKKVVSFVGKLTDFKGVDVLINSIPLYEDPDTLTLIAGDGELRPALEQQAKDLNIQNLKFLGNQPQSTLNEIYNIANCSTVPSRREPFGLVAAEAMLCGTPVIATNQGGLPDFVTPDVGTLVDVEDSNGLANAINSVLTGKKTFDRDHIAEKIKEEYSQDALIKRFVDIYEEAISKKKIANTKNITDDQERD